MVTSRSVFQQNFENYNEQIRMESLRNLLQGEPTKRWKIKNLARQRN